MSKYTLPIMALAGIAAPAWSAVVNDNVELPALNSIIVTATRIEQSPDAVLAPVTAFERSDLERLQSKDVVDVLQHSPGVEVVRSGGMGSAASLFIRGANSGQTLFLIDGQRISSATLGSTNFQLLDPEQIERIEVLRGPRSSLYGSDAIGGVVQIFTRRGIGEPTAYVKAGYGNRDSSQISAGGDGQLEKFSYAANLSQYVTEGISQLDDKQGNNGDRDAYRNNSANLHLGYDFTDSTALDFSHFYTSSKNEYDSSYAPSDQPYDRNWIQNSQVSLTTSLTDIWNLLATASRSIDDADTYNKSNTAEQTNFRTTRNSATLQNDLHIGEAQTFTLGADYYKDTVDSSSPFEKADGTPVHSRDHKGYFAQYLLTQTAFDIQAGVRRDNTEDFSSQTTGNIAVGFTLPAEQKLILSYGTGFKAPTFNDLYWPIDPYSFGNPNLKAETSKNYEIEWRAHISAFNLSANLFRNDISNLIDWAPVDPNDIYSPYTPSNVSNAKIQGVEFSANSNFMGWVLNGSVSYIDPRDENTDNLLVNRSRRSLILDADRQFDAWSFGASWRAHDFSYADMDNTQRVSGYGLVDVRASYDFTKALQGQLKLNNIFDKDYEERKGYNVERFGIFATVTYRL